MTPFFRASGGRRGVLRALGIGVTLVLALGLVAVGVRGSGKNRAAHVRARDDGQLGTDDGEPTTGGVVNGSAQTDSTLPGGPDGRAGAGASTGPSTTRPSASDGPGSATGGDHDTPPARPPDPRLKLFVPPHIAIGNFPAEPSSLAVSGGNLWFNTRNHAIGRITPDGSMTLYPTPDIVADHLAAGPDGNVWFTDSVGNPDGYRVGYIRPDGAVKYFVVSGFAPAELKGIVAGPDGAMWFAMYGSDAGAGRALLGRVSMDGAVSVRQVGVGGVSGLASGPDGALWVLNGAAVRRVSVDGTVESFDVPDGWVLNGAPVVGPDGNLWMVAGKATGEDRLVRLTSAGAFTMFELPFGFDPVALALGPDGAFWITSGMTHSIARVSTHGKILEMIDLGGLSAWAITPGPDGDVWITAIGPPEGMDRTAYLGRIKP